MPIPPDLPVPRAPTLEGVFEAGPGRRPLDNDLELQELVLRALVQPAASKTRPPLDADSATPEPPVTCLPDRRPTRR